jgi:NADPH-dependent ferric siderophore reductase
MTSTQVEGNAQSATGLAGALEDDAVDAAIAAEAPDILATVNSDFEDSVLLVGRVLGEVPQASAAKVTSVDRAGVDVVVSDPDGDHTRRLDFSEPVGDPTELGAAFVALVLRAGELSDDESLTSAKRELHWTDSLGTYLAEVVAVRDINPHLREVTMRGSDLHALPSAGPDSFVSLLLPPPGRTDLTIDRTFTWEGYAKMAEDDQPATASYTIRRSRPDEGEIDVLMVLHGDAGPASRWASRTQPGDTVGIWGPRTTFEPPESTDWYLLAADETGLPAVAAILESLPEGTTARVFAEVAGEAERQALPASPPVEVTWLHRDGAPAGTATVLLDAVKAMPWPGGSAYAWGGGESRVMTALRRHLRDQVGLERESVSMTAYWRHADPDGELGKHPGTRANAQ